MRVQGRLTRVPAAAVIAVLAMAVVGPHAKADIFVPPGLLPGDQYHIVFVSQVAGMASQQDIAFYNALIQTEAMQNPGLTGTDLGVEYRAIGSTLNIDALDNVPITAPVYLLDGTKIADGFDDMWDGELDNPINIDQFGNLVPDGLVWTGTMPNGLRWICPPDIFYNLGAPFPRFGQTWSTNGDWTGVNEDFNTSNYRFYGLSDRLTVPGTIPEPGAMALGVLILAGAAAVYRRRSARVAPQLR